MIYIPLNMKETNTIEIKYRSKAKAIGEGIFEYEYETIRADVAHTKRYNAAVCLLMGVNGCAHHLIDYLSNNLSEGGYVNNNSITRMAFIEFHKKNKATKNKPYSESAVQKAFTQLANKEFLVQVIKGVFKINPMLYFNGADESRIKKIKMMMEFNKGTDTSFKTEVTT